jgi:hypothetical protein
MEQSEEPNSKQCMDNVVKFPQKETKVTYVSPAKEEDFGYALEMFCTMANGVQVSLNLSWQDIMIAMIVATANCAVKADLTEDEFVAFLQRIKAGEFNEQH